MKKVFVLSNKTHEILVTSYKKACDAIGKKKVDAKMKYYKDNGIDINDIDSLKALWLCGFQYIVDIDTMKRKRLFK